MEAAGERRDCAARVAGITVMVAAGVRRPESVLVVIHDGGGRVLLLRRRDLGFWQSVTGSLEWSETDAREAACREVCEETGIEVSPAALRDWRVEHHFRILPELASRFATGVTRNVERLFSLAVAADVPVATDAGEHDAWGWFDADAAVDTCWSWSNRLGIHRVLACA